MDAKTSQSFSVDQANFKFCHKLRSNEENPSETDVYVTPKVHDNDDIIPEVGRFRRFIQNRILVREKFKHAKVSNQNGDVALNHEDEKNITELEGLETIYDGFYYGMRIAQREHDNRLIGYLNETNFYEWLTYSQVELLATNIGRFLSDKAGLSTGDIVGINSKTRAEWLITFIGCVFKSFTVTPVYDTLGDEACAHIIDQTEMRAMFVSTIDDARKLIRVLAGMQEAGKEVKLRHIVLLDTPPSSSMTEFHKFQKENEAKYNIYAFNEVATGDEQSWKLWIQKTSLAAIEDQRQYHLPPKKDDILEICYTSGTTGVPKGVVYRHKNMIALIVCLRVDIDDILEEGREVFICYLPLAHAYEIAVECFGVTTGCKLGYYNGDARNLAADMKNLRPTIVTAVPRVLTRIHEGIDKKTSREESGALKAFMFKQAVRKQWKKLVDDANEHLKNPFDVNKKQPNRRTRRTFIYDRFIFKKVQEQFGGNLKAIFVGSSATPPKTLQFLRSVLGCYVCEGFGQTESYGIAFLQHHYDMNTGSIGRPLSSVQFKLRDVPDLGYKNARQTLVGELCLRGSSIMAEYYKEPEKTRETVDADGWIGTGDIARLNPNRTVSIFDRKKHIFKLIQGEYVVPERVESVYKTSKLIDDILVFGKPMWTSVVAVVFVNLDEARNVLKCKAITLNELNENEVFIRVLQNELNMIGAKSDLKGFEKIKAFVVAEKPMFDYTDMVTPTLKPMRHLFASHFNEQLERVYAGIVDKPL